MTDSQLRIAAEVHSDDRVFEAHFDAAPWFATASDEEIEALALCGWGGDYAADEVALAMEEYNTDVERVLEYVHAIADRRDKKDVCGFECYVEAKDALAWLDTNRPALAERLRTEV